MPVSLFSADGTPRLHIFEDRGDSRIRLQRAAGPGDSIVICGCSLPHLSGIGGALKCPGRVLTISFRPSGLVEVDEGPEYGRVRDVHHG